MALSAKTDTIVLTLAQIEDAAARALRHHGAAPAAASSLARAIAAAEGEGIHSHGLHYLSTYCEHLDCGKVDGAAVPGLRRTAAAALVADAAHGFAHPAIDLGFDSLMPLARETGLAGLAVTRSYNCGVLGYHVARIARAGLIGIGFTNAPASIAPPGGRRPVIGTNPFAVAVPGETGDPRIVIDQSASTVSKSELSARAARGEAIPEGWALDADGNPTTDPRAGLAGTMVPSGGYKGFGAGLFVEIMAAALSGANLGLHAAPFSGPAGGPPGTGQFFIAISADSFSGDVFQERMGALCAAVEVQDGTRLPGARRAATLARSSREGVAVPRALVDKARALAGDAV